MSQNRRTFLLAGAAVSVVPAAPSDQVVLGVIGCGGRGTLVMTVFQKDPAVRVGAVSDVYEPNLERALSTASKTPGNKPAAYRNYRRMLEDKDITAVLIATPEHWHHRMILDALAAGKDVYVEKPLCQTPVQGIELVDAERRSRNIIQVGMQRRSYDLYLEARQVVAAGTLGRIRMVRSWWLNNSLGGSATATLEGPLDWEEWQGPAARHVPPDPFRFRHWREFSDYAGGIVADQGAHVYDGIHLLMDSGGPVAVTAAAGKPHAPKVDTPESVVVAAEYAEDFVAVFTVNYAAMRYKSRNDQMNSLDGDRGRMDVGREDFRVFSQGAEETPVMARKSEKGFGAATDLHVANFLECIRTRKTPTAPIAKGFLSALVVQLANLSIRSGRRVRWNPETRRVEM